MGCDAQLDHLQCGLEPTEPVNLKYPGIQGYVSGFDTKFRHVRSIKAYERTKSHGYVNPEKDYVGLGRHTKMYAVYVWETLERQGRDTLMVKLFTKFVISSSIHTKSRNFGGPIQGPIVMRMDG